MRNHPRQRCLKVRLIVGIWQARDNRDQLAQRLAAAHADAVVTELAAAVDEAERQLGRVDVPQRAAPAAAIESEAPVDRKLERNIPDDSAKRLC